MCRVLGVSTRGYYAWRRRPTSARKQADAALTNEIERIHQASRQTYGSPRIHAELREDGTRVGRKRVARLMRQARMAGVTRRKYVRTTQRDAGDRPAPDLVNREFAADGPDQLWVADITYIPTLAGFLYLAVVLDVWSRKIVGWSMSTRLATKIVGDALTMAFDRRQPGNGLIHHSDQGCQYTSIEFGRRCREYGIRPSMGSVGDCYDNAMCESFFATLECELLDRSRFLSTAEAELAVFDFIEGFYNTRRRHSSIGYLAPAVFEARAARAATPPSPRADTPSSVLPLKGEEARRPAHAAASLPTSASARISSNPRRLGSASTP
jgi:putative transposase